MVVGYCVISVKLAVVEPKCSAEHQHLLGNASAKPMAGDLLDQKQLRVARAALRPRPPTDETQELSAQNTPAKCMRSAYLRLSDLNTVL